MTAPLPPKDAKEWLRSLGVYCDHEFMTDIGRVKCGVKQGHTGDHICHYEHTFTCKQGETHDS